MYLPTGILIQRFSMSLIWKGMNWSYIINWFNTDKLSFGVKAMKSLQSSWPHSEYTPNKTISQYLCMLNMQACIKALLWQWWSTKAVQHNCHPDFVSEKNGEPAEQVEQTILWLLPLKYSLLSSYLKLN